MKNFLVAAVLAASIATPSLAMAADAPPMATLACRPIATGEKSNASMGSTTLLCRRLDTAQIEAAMTEMHQMGAKMTDADKAHMDADMSMIFNQYHFPKYPGQYPSNEYG